MHGVVSGSDPFPQILRVLTFDRRAEQSSATERRGAVKHIDQIEIRSAICITECSEKLLGRVEELDGPFLGCSGITAMCAEVSM